MAASDSEGVLSICLGSPNTIVLTGSEFKYDFKKGTRSLVSTVSKPEAIICMGSVTAIPVLFVPKSKAIIRFKLFFVQK
jgi:hypothetical protein